MLKKSIKGAIGAVEIVLIIVVILAIGFVVWQVADSDDDSGDDNGNGESSEMIQEEDDTEEEPEEITLNSVGNFEGTGTATRQFVDGTFTHTVTAELDAPADGKFYEGWLVKGGDFFSTGELELNDGVYTLTFTSGTDYTEYNQVVITSETSANGLDGNPEDHVLEGSF